MMPMQVFQCLLIEGENAGPEAIKNAATFVITDEQFKSFINRHSSLPQLVPESNDMMRESYLILDEYVRNLREYSSTPSPPSLKLTHRCTHTCTHTHKHTHTHTGTHIYKHTNT